MKVDYIVLIQLILYSLGLSCLELLGLRMPQGIREMEKSKQHKKREGQKGPSSEVDISQ
jgi:hypothetical protein